MSELRDFVQKLEQRLVSQPEDYNLENVLKGKAIELYCDLVNETLFIVADEEDARRLGEPRGSIYSGSEVRRVCQIKDRATVREVHAYKKNFGGRLSEYIDHKKVGTEGNP